jgi:hypothetical protein
MKKDRKTTFIIVRTTPEEKIEIIKKAGKNLSRYIRLLLGLK